MTSLLQKKPKKVAEEWRPITMYGPPFDQFYEVSSRGAIRSLFRSPPRLLSLHTKPDGYVLVNLKVGKHHHMPRVHRLVAHAFLGPIKPGLEVNHIDGNKANNAISNLAYVTRHENIAHARKIGLIPQKTAAKLTPEQVHEIWQIFLRGGVKVKDIAALYGVCDSNVTTILKGRSWPEIAEVYVRSKAA